MRNLTLALMGFAVMCVHQTGYTADILYAITVKYDSSPRSALVTCEGASQGYTPVDVKYNAVYNEKDGLLYAPSCNATWQSGAQSSYDTVVGKPKQKYSSFKVKRPKYPDISVDVEFDDQRQKDNPGAYEAIARQRAADEALATKHRVELEALRNQVMIDRKNAADADAIREAEANNGGRAVAEAESQRKLNEALKNLSNSFKTTTTRCQQIGFQMVCNTY